MRNREMGPFASDVYKKFGDLQYKDVLNEGITYKKKFLKF
jgi:hypothetical protein